MVENGNSLQTFLARNSSPTTEHPPPTSTTPKSRRMNPSSLPPLNTDQPFASSNKRSHSRHDSWKSPFSARPSRRTHEDSQPPSMTSPRHQYPQETDTSNPDPRKLKLHHIRTHSSSRDTRERRKMSHASSSSTRGLMPTWSGKERNRDADDSLLRPITNETSRSRFASDSSAGLSTGSRKGSFVYAVEPTEKIGLVREEPRSMEDLEEVKKKRKQGEEYFRSALSSIGTLATDITRRLDYTYYNLLEKYTALTSTIASFQELSTSTSSLFNDFERETSGLEQEIRKQVGEVKEFQPQIQKIESLEERMRAGRQKAELLGGRLEVMRSEIDDWEKRETEWQMRVGRRLRIFWSTIAAGVLALVVAIIIQNVRSPDPETLLQKTALENYSSRLEQVEEPELHSAGQKDHYPRSLYPSGVAHRHESCQAASPTDSPASTDRETGSSTADPLRILDEI